MIGKPTLIVHTTHFATTNDATDPEFAAAATLGEDLYKLLTRPVDDPLVWGAGIPVRVASRADQIDVEEAKHVVVIPVLGHDAFVEADVQEAALQRMRDLVKAGARVLPVLESANWRNVETQMPKPILAKLFASVDPRRTTLNEILLFLSRVLSGNDGYTSQLFISHAKADKDGTGNAAELIRAYISGETTGKTFFDKVSILPGEDLASQIDSGVEQGVFVVVRGDRYSSRTWCRRELLGAKKKRVPTLVVEVLGSGEARSAAYGGNGPTMVWDRGAKDGAGAATVMTQAMVEVVCHLFFMAESTRVIAAAELPSSTERLSRPPELLDLATLRDHSDRSLVVLHPDPPLPTFERDLLQEADKRLRLVTPTTAFAGAIGSSIRVPLEGWQVALSLSDVLGKPDEKSAERIARAQLNDATVFLARAIIGMGGAIAYGGDFRNEGFTPLLARLVLDYNETARRPADLLHCYLGVPITARGEGLSFTRHSMRSSRQATLPLPAGEITKARSALYFSDMRRCMALSTHARVILGGTIEPKSQARPGGYGGRLPGVIEEAWRTLQHGKPLYVAGGFGGAAEVLVQALEQDEAPSQLRDATWNADPAFAELALAVDTDPDGAKLELPKNQEALALAIRGFGAAYLASDEAARNWNGLSVEENRTLFRTRDPLTLAALVTKGLLATYSRLARGKLQIELVEGDLGESPELEALVFASFTDVGMDGAGRAIDAISGGAATRAHETRTVVSSRSSKSNALVYAAELGDIGAALRDIPGTARRAAAATAEVLRRQRFTQVGIVTFLGNVAPNLGDVVRAMVEGLRGAADVSQLTWFERDPLRAAIIAATLSENPDVVLTRRAAPLPPQAPELQRKRTVINVRHAQAELDVALLLHEANGLAPVVRSPLADSDRQGLAGKTSDRVPKATELAKRGARIAELLFGPEAQPILASAADSELVILHDQSAGGIPYEALAWSGAAGDVTPATSGGIVRHLLAPGISPTRAVRRRPRVGKLGVLVIINPLQDLPGAELEGDALLAQLGKEHFNVVSLRGKEATVEAVRAGLEDPKIDVLHYCGHAFFKGLGSDESGLNCADGALTVSHLRGLASVPRLAFVNACQAGRVRGDAGAAREPEAFAEFFLRAGVDAYLGAFWLVSDQGAALFAASVYAALKGGNDLGAAVIAGRQRLKQEQNNDWANYVLYGDARFRLVRGADEGQALVATEELPSASVRVDGGIIVASWTFRASEVPDVFHVAALDPSTDAPITLAAPMRVERREGWAGAISVVTWVVTVIVPSTYQGAVQLRPSQGAAIDALAERAAPDARSALAEEPTPAEQVMQLRALLSQQPDGGRAVLRALSAGASPDELRAELDNAAAQIAKADGEDAARALWPFTKKVSKAVDALALTAFTKAYELPTIDVNQAADETFQTKEDWEKYTFAKGAIAFVTGSDVLEPKWPKLASPASSLTHELRPGEFDGSIEVAMFADNGNGLHSSLAIARQIVAAKLPYAFHLGDIYYGGSKREVADFFEAPLKPMFDQTELFMLTGNHEMFAKGEWFQDLIQRKAEAHPQRQRQQGEMFRLRGPNFQIIGIDTMFSGWNARRFRVHDQADPAVLKVLDTWLDERKPGELTVLMTTNEPWDLGSKRLTKLYESLRTTIAGRVDLWFWGNVHYAALYEPWQFGDAGSPACGVVGSCIGHGGYPYYTQEAKSMTDVPEGVGCRWLETKSRFWPNKRLRPEVGANGWCRMKLTRSDARWQVQLTYVDWVGRERLRAQLAKPDDASIRFEAVEESDQEDVGRPSVWRPVPPPKAT